MSDASPTRCAGIEMQDERRAVHEGCVFLDEKCLLLAGVILRQLVWNGQRQQRFALLHLGAEAALQTAIARHGLQGLQVHPPADRAGTGVQITARSLMGVACRPPRGGPMQPPSTRLTPQPRP